MNIERFVYFMSVARHMNFTKAAAEHNIAQTAMSRHIAMLENQLDVQLFERDGRGVRLTRAGTYFYDQLQIFMDRYYQLITQVKNIDKGGFGQLSIGIGQYEHVLSEQIISGFRRQYPGVSLTISQHLYDELLYKFNNGFLDVIFAFTACTLEIDLNEAMVRPICPFIEYIVVQADHKLAGQEIAHPQELAKETFVTLSEEKGPCSIDSFKAYTTKFGFLPAKYIKANSLEAQLLMVNLGLGISFLPGVCQKHLSGNLTTLRLKNPVSGDFVVICRKNSPNPSTGLFVDYAAQVEIARHFYHI